MTTHTSQARAPRKATTPRAQSYGEDTVSFCTGLFRGLRLALRAHRVSAGPPLIAATALAASATFLAAQQAPSVFTVDQAAAGRAAYQANCASCHMPDLAGRNEAPPLAGGTFMN